MGTELDLSEIEISLKLFEKYEYPEVSKAICDKIPPQIKEERKKLQEAPGKLQELNKLCATVQKKILQINSLHDLNIAENNFKQDAIRITSQNEDGTLMQD